MTKNEKEMMAIVLEKRAMRSWRNARRSSEFSATVTSENAPAEGEALDRSPLAASGAEPDRSGGTMSALAYAEPRHPS